MPTLHKSPMGKVPPPSSKVTVASQLQDNHELLKTESEILQIQRAGLLSKCLISNPQPSYTRSRGGLGMSISLAELPSPSFLVAGWAAQVP